MKVRIVVAQFAGSLAEDLSDTLAAGNDLLEWRQIREACIEPLDGREKFLERILLDHDPRPPAAQRIRNVREPKRVYDITRVTAECDAMRKPRAKRGAALEA